MNERRKIGIPCPRCSGILHLVLLEHSDGYFPDCKGCEFNDGNFYSIVSYGKKIKHALAHWNKHYPIGDMVVVIEERTVDQ